MNFFTSEFKIENMNGRPVFFREYDSRFDKEHGIKCADCLGNPKFLIFELDGSKWVYCGICMVG